MTSFYFLIILTILLKWPYRDPRAINTQLTL